MRRPKKASKVPEDGADSVEFVAAMKGLGLDEFPTDTTTGFREDAASDREPSEEEEGALFLEAIGQVDSAFREEISEEEKPSSSPQRMKQFRRGRLAIDAELDLHGLDRHQALQRVKFFIEDSYRQDCQTLRVITGQGFHSADEPVLRVTVEAYLREDKPWCVKEWGRAPRRFGGAGALILFLKRSKSTD